jgi:hypothetical protein
MSVVCLDFDGVLHDNLHPISGRRMGPPMPGAVEACHRLIANGNHLIVCTANHLSPAHPGQAARLGNHIEQWLHYWKFPVELMPVTNVKPLADVYVDDKGLAFTSWGDGAMLMEMQRRLSWHNGHAGSAKTRR